MTNIITPFYSVPPAGDGTTPVAASILQPYLDKANASSSAKAIMLPSGVFICEQTLLIGDNVSLIGAPGRSTILKTANAANVDILRNSAYASAGSGGTNTGITVRDIVFDGNSANQTAYTPSTSKTGLSLLAAFNVTVKDCVFQNVAGVGMRADGNALKVGSGWFANLHAINCQFIGMRWADGLRICFVTAVESEGCGDCGNLFDASQMVINGAYAWNNNLTGSAYPAGNYFRNTTGNVANGIVSAQNGLHGTYAGGFRESSGAGWASYQNSQRLANGWDDLHLGPNDDQSAYGENANLTISGIYLGSDTQLAAGTDPTNFYSRYGLYVGDESNQNIRLDGVVYGSARTAARRPPASWGSLFINGVQS